MKKDKKVKKKPEEILYKFEKINTIFIVIALITIIFQKNMGSDEIPILIYVIAFAIYWFITLFIWGVISTKHFCDNKKVIMMMIRLFIQFILLSYLIIFSVVNVEVSEFEPNAVKTNAYVSNIKSEIEFEEDECSGKIRTGNKCCYAGSNNCIHANDYYYVKYTYTYKYVVNNEEYSAYLESKNGHYGSKKLASELSKPKYKKGDKKTIYYNKKRPSQTRWSLRRYPIFVIYLFEITILLIQFIPLMKLRYRLKNKIK